MSEIRILTARCPGCNTAVRVKTHSLEKTVACPKCKASVTVSATSTSSPVVSAEEELPVAEYWPDALSTGKGRIVPALGMLVAALIVGVAISYLFREGGTLPSKTDVIASNIHRPDPEPVNKESEPGKAEEPKTTVQGNKEEPRKPASVSPEKAAYDRALARVRSLERQHRDWKAANYGREAAKQKGFQTGKGSQVIVLQLPEAMQRIYNEALRDLEMAKSEYERSK
ncbi:MAG: hypothetical protein JNJ77_17465 [Planctomycetia bacterium]|nr:hypothetical protein [Planctomycetia bacterium]